jgi:hypothetical protein
MRQSSGTLSHGCWMRLWRERFPDVVKLRPQPLTGHSNGFSPVWLVMWSLSAKRRRKVLLQPSTGQGNDRRLTAASGASAWTLPAATPRRLDWTATTAVKATSSRMVCAMVCCLRLGVPQGTVEWNLSSSLTILPRDWCIHMSAWTSSACILQTVQGGARVTRLALASSLPSLPTSPWRRAANEVPQGATRYLLVLPRTCTNKVYEEYQNIYAHLCHPVTRALRFVLQVFQHATAP